MVGNRIPRTQCTTQGMLCRVCKVKSPNRMATRQPVPPRIDPTWRGMTPDRIAMAGRAVCMDFEDVTDEERDALSEFLTLGGNPWAL